MRPGQARCEPEDVTPELDARIATPQDVDGPGHRSQVDALGRVRSGSGTGIKRMPSHRHTHHRRLSALRLTGAEYLPVQGEKEKDRRIGGPRWGEAMVSKRKRYDERHAEPILEHPVFARARPDRHNEPLEGKENCENDYVGMRGAALDAECLFHFIPWCRELSRLPGSCHNAG